MTTTNSLIPGTTSLTKDIEAPRQGVEAVRAVRDEIEKLIEGRTAEMSPELVSRVQRRTPAAQT